MFLRLLINSLSSFLIFALKDFDLFTVFVSTSFGLLRAFKIALTVEHISIDFFIEFFSMKSD